MINIKSKQLQQRLFRVGDHKLVSVKESSLWFRKESMKPRDEGVLCFLQDRNVFFGEMVKFPHCKAADKTVDHLATKCDRMLEHDYTKRHN